MRELAPQQLEAKASDGNVIRDGFDVQLDEARANGARLPVTAV